MISSLQEKLIECAIENGALKFDVENMFQLKSGRMSPYFFNAAAMNSGKAMHFIARCYAEVIAHGVDCAEIKFDVIFGPAYKGISLAAIVAESLYSQYGKDYPIAYNRKEAKDHGEGGKLVGASLDGKRVLIVDDVITAGTAVRESVEIIKSNGGIPGGLIVFLDRQETAVAGEDEEIPVLSAVQEVMLLHHMPVMRILTLDHLVRYAEQSQSQEVLDAMGAYRERYGIPR